MAQCHGGAGRCGLGTFPGRVRVPRATTGYSLGQVDVLSRGHLRSSSCLGTAVDRRDLGGIPKARELGMAQMPGLAQSPGPWLGFWQGNVAPKLFGDREVPEVGLGMAPSPHLSGHHVFSLGMNLLTQVMGQLVGRVPAPGWSHPSAVAPGTYGTCDWDLPGAKSGGAMGGGVGSLGGCCGLGMGGSGGGWQRGMGDSRSG